MVAGKTLYISDLDGTLLDRRGNLSQYSASVIRRFIGAGGLFSIATSRSLQSCDELIWLLGLKIPAILVNGATIYDSVHKAYLEVQSIPHEAIRKLIGIFEAYNLCGFIYMMRNGEIDIYYNTIRHDCEISYCAQRVERYTIYAGSNLEAASQTAQPVLMVAYSASMDLLCRMQNDITKLHGVSSEVYENVYDGNFYLDIFPASASKAQGMLTLQKITQSEELVAFGDNFNDMSMLLAADRAYVPKNAVNSTKHIATSVLDYCYNDAVAHFLAQEMGWE